MIRSVELPAVAITALLGYYSLLTSNDERSQFRAGRGMLDKTARNFLTAIYLDLAAVLLN